MAINPQNFDKSDPMKWCSESSQGSGQGRSYTCAFCQKGFSNAQALGGHMNIHRRDRAKLKQAADENSFPLDVALNPTDHDQPQALEEKSCSPPKKTSSLDEVGTEKLHQLSLFFERPSERDCAGRKEEKGIQAASQLTAKKVDLELRLGPEPQETSTTREFFQVGK